MNEPYPIRCERGHDLGTMTGPILVMVRCEDCGGYVQSYRAEGVPALADATEIGRCQDNYGDEIVFSVLNDSVCVQFFRPDGKNWIGMWLAVKPGDDFTRLLTEARTKAGRYLCATPDDCVNGPEAHPFVAPTVPCDELPCCRQPWENDSPAPGTGRTSDE